MSKPSKPLDIRSSRPADDRTETPGSLGRAPIVGTPTGRNGGRGTPATPTIANIPLRGSDGLPASSSLPRGSPMLPRTPQTGGSSTPIGESSSGLRVNLDDVTEEEMARVLRRHLVPRRGVEGEADDNGVGGSSRRPSESVPSSTRNGEDGDDNKQPPAPQRQDSETFPIPYDAPGGDITCVPSQSINTLYLSYELCLAIPFINGKVNTGEKLLDLERRLSQLRGKLQKGRYLSTSTSQEAFDETMSSAAQMKKAQKNPLSLLTSSSSYIYSVTL